MIASGHGIVDKSPTPNALTDTTPVIDESYTIDTTSPTIVSFERYDPTDEHTGSTTLVFRATFSEDVENVDESDFEVSSSNTANGTVTSVSSITSSVYDVTILVDGDGTFNLDMIASGHGIGDKTDTSNPLTNAIPSVSDESYTVDTTLPSVLSFERSTPTDEHTSSTTLVFRATFNEDVANVDASDFVVFSNDSTGNVGIVSKITDSIYDIAVSVDGDGTFNLDIASSHNIVDRSDPPNPLTDVTPAVDESYTVDTTSPAILSFERFDPTDEHTSSTTLVFRATFSEDVENVDESDFEVSSSTTANGTISHVLQFTAYTYDVTVLVDGDGTFNLDMITSGHDIVDKADTSNPLTNPAPAVDESYTVDTTSPTVVSFERFNPTDELTSSTELVFRVTFDEPVTSVNASDFEVSSDSVATGQVTDVSATNDLVYDVTVLVDGDGTFNLDIIPGHDIGDRSIPPNPLADTIPSGNDQSYTVDTTSPTVVSFERFNPTDELTSSTELVFRVTFDEPVTGVDASDFVVNSNGSTTGNATTVSKIDDLTYHVTVLVDGDDTFSLDMITSGHSIVDKATPSNPLTDTMPSGSYQSYTVDATPPTILSFERHLPVENPTSIRTLVFNVTFAEPVTGVDKSDFEISSVGNATGTVSLVSPVDGDLTYYVTVLVDGDDTFSLDMITSGHSIVDKSIPPNELTDTTPAIDESYTVDVTILDTTSPTVVSFERFNPTDEFTSSTTLVFRVTFDEIVENVDESDFELSSNNNVTSSITDVSAFTNFIYDVTALVDGDGTFKLTIVSDHDIEDGATTPNALTNTAPPISNDESYIVDATIPVITSPIDGFITNSTQLAINGTAKADSTITLDKDGNVIASHVPTNASGNWTTTIPVLEGIHTFTAINTAGLSSSIVTVTVDTTPPSPSSASYNIDTGELAIVFNETLADPPNYHLFNVSAFGPNPDHILLSDVANVSLDDNIITAVLNSTQQETYASLPVPSITIMPNSVSDLAGNSFAHQFTMPISEYSLQSSGNGNGGNGNGGSSSSGSSPIVDVTKALDAHLLDSRLY